MMTDSMDHQIKTPADNPADDGASLPPRGLRRRVWLERAAAVAFSFCMAAACLVLYTRHNDFTPAYHPDEPGKISQILSDGSRRNLNHPLLMLEAAHWAHKWLGAPRDPQAVVEIGRLVSAGMAVGTVVALAWLGYAVAGLIGMLVVGMVMGLCPQLLTYAHYLKEDTSLVFGIAVVLLGTRLTWSARRWWTRILALTVLGAGVGLAASGKYPGAATLALAMPVAILAPRLWLVSRLIAPVWVVITAVAVAMLVNHRVINDLDAIYEQLPQAAGSGMTWVERGDAAVRALFQPDIVAAFERELDHSTEGHHALTMDRPNGFFIGLFGDETMLHVRILAVVYLVSVVGTVAWKLRRWWDVWIILFAAGYLGMLSMSVIGFHRYFLPVAVMTYLFAALGLLAVINAFSWSWKARMIATAGALVLIGTLQGARCANFIGQFADDSRHRVRAWVRDTLPPGTRMVVDNYTGLSHYTGDHRPSQQTGPLGVWVRGYMFAPEFGSMERLRSQRIEYVAVCDIAYARFFNPHARDTPYAKGRLESYRQWYEALDRDHELVWSEPPRPNMHAFTNPEIKVYRLKWD